MTITLIAMYYYTYKYFTVWLHTKKFNTNFNKFDYNFFVKNINLFDNF